MFNCVVCMLALGVLNVQVGLVSDQPSYLTSIWSETIVSDILAQSAPINTFTSVGGLIYKNGERLAVQLRMVVTAAGGKRLRDSSPRTPLLSGSSSRASTGLGLTATVQCLTGGVEKL